MTSYLANSINSLLTIVKHTGKDLRLQHDLRNSHKFILLMQIILV